MLGKKKNSPENDHKKPKREKKESRTKNERPSKKERQKGEIERATPEQLAKKTEEERAFIRMIEKAQQEVAANELLKPVKKKKGMAALNDALRNVSYKTLNTKIRGYGYDFEMKDFLVKTGIVLAGMIIASMIFSLKWYATVLLILIALGAYPTIILAQFRNTSNNAEFEQIVSYLDQMIIAFKNNPKILLSMQTSLDLLEGKMKDKVEEAIRVIQEDAKSPNVYKRAFNIIESEFKCSRIRTLHRFMFTVETENSVDYQDSMDNLYMDVRSWQTRTYKFQAALKDTKGKITILLLGSIGIAALFAYILKTVEKSSASEISAAQAQKLIADGNSDLVFQDQGVWMEKMVQIINSPVYQIATVIFFALFIILYTIMNTKIHGYWLVRDLENPKDELILKNMHQLALIDPEQDKKNNKIILFMGIPFFIASIVLWILGNSMWKTLLIVSIAFMIFIIKFKDINRGSKRKAIMKNLNQDFPLWMRDIAINLKNRVVVRAVAESLAESPYVMKPFIWNFLAHTEKSPSSLTPYINFFGEYGSQDLTTAVKTLYSIRTLSPEDSQKQVNDLVERNQELLAEAEKQRHEDSIAGVSMLSLLPMVIMSFLLMVYMVVMLIEFMSLVGGAM